METLSRVKRAARRRAAAGDEFRAAIGAAHAAGVPIRRIGDAAGVSHVRVLQIVNNQTHQQPLHGANP